MELAGPSDLQGGRDPDQGGGEVREVRSDSQTLARAEMSAG